MTPSNRRWRRSSPLHWISETTQDFGSFEKRGEVRFVGLMFVVIAAAGGVQVAMELFSGANAHEAAREASKCGARCDERLVMHHVANGGCLDDFNKAMEECRGHYSPEALGWDKQRGAAERIVDDVEACAKATAALRKCFAGNPAVFEHQYLRRIDEGLDQDTKASEYQIRRDGKDIFRWWTGIRRS